MVRVHYFQHVPFERLGSIEPWLETRGYKITATQFFKAETLPQNKKQLQNYISDIDFLIVLGGSMSANDEEKFPWLTDEKRFIYNFIKSGKPVLGICLGAQLIASALGAKVYNNPEKEIGWFRVQGLFENKVATGKLSTMSSSTFYFPPSFNAFHWHGETFDLPHGAQLIARSEACMNQAFQIGKAVTGLQFHLEMTPRSVREIVLNCKGELKKSRYVQTEEEIISTDPENYTITNELMGQLLDFITQLH